MPGPIPRWLSWCVCPFLPRRASAFPMLEAGRLPRLPHKATSCGHAISGLQPFLYVQASMFACLGIAPDNRDLRPEGRPRRFHPNTPQVVTFLRPGYASRPIRAIGGRGLTPHKTSGLVGRIHRDRTGARASLGRGLPARPFGLRGGFPSSTMDHVSPGPPAIPDGRISRVRF